jgi:hypothetical protein
MLRMGTPFSKLRFTKVTRSVSEGGKSRPRLRFGLLDGDRKRLSSSRVESKTCELPAASHRPVFFVNFASFCSNLLAKSRRGCSRFTARKTPKEPLVDLSGFTADNRKCPRISQISANEGIILDDEDARFLTHSRSFA